MKFIEFSDEIINTKHIGTIWKKNEHIDGNDLYIVCISDFYNRNMLGEPQGIYLSETYVDEVDRNIRYKQLKKLLVQKNA